MIYSVISSPKNSQLNKPVKLSPNQIDLPQLLNKKIEIKLAQNYTFPNYPEKLEIYQGRVVEINLNEKLNKLGNLYKLQKNTRLDNYWSNSDESIILYVEKSNNTLSYNINFDSYPVFYFGKYNPTLNSALTASEKLINTLNLDETLQFQDTKTQYHIMKSGEPINSTSTDYDTITLFFAQKISNYPLYYHDNPSPLIKITVGQNNTILKYEIKPTLISITKTIKNLKSYDFSQVVEQISNRKSGVLNITNYPDFPPELNKITQITIQSSQIEYRLHKIKDTLVPYLRLQGIAKSDSNTTDSKIELLIPLINPDEI